MTKAQFKNMYKSGQLLWVATVFNTPLDTVISKVSEKVNSGVNLSDYARNVSGNDKNNVDGKQNSVFYDESENTVYVNMQNKSGNTVIIYTLA